MFFVRQLDSASGASDNKPPLECVLSVGSPSRFASSSLHPNTAAHCLLIRSTSRANTRRLSNVQQPQNSVQVQPRFGIFHIQSQSTQFEVAGQLIVGYCMGFYMLGSAKHAACELHVVDGALM
jgi:hypothetical protein